MLRHLGAIKANNGNKSNKIMSFDINDDKLLEKYVTIFTKIEDLKTSELNALPVYDNRYII